MCHFPSGSDHLPGPVREYLRLALLAGHSFGPGEIFQFESGGGGGWGNPKTRPVAEVLDDVLDEYVSIKAARSEYGVVIDPKAYTVDETATAELRKAGA